MVESEVLRQSFMTLLQKITEVSKIHGISHLQPL